MLFPIVCGHAILFLTYCFWRKCYQWWKWLHAYNSSKAFLLWELSSMISVQDSFLASACLLHHVGSLSLRSHDSYVYGTYIHVLGSVPFPSTKYCGRLMKEKVSYLPPPPSPAKVNLGWLRAGALVTRPSSSWLSVLPCHERGLWGSSLPTSYTHHMTSISAAQKKQVSANSSPILRSKEMLEF